MNEQHITRITLGQYRTSLSYSEEETVHQCHVDVETLHQLRASGFIAGEETNGELRYSESEVVQLRLIRRLNQDLEINMAGIEVILRMRRHIESLQQALELERWQTHHLHKALNQPEGAPSLPIQHGDDAQ